MANVLSSCFHVQSNIHCQYQSLPTLGLKLTIENNLLVWRCTALIFVFCNSCQLETMWMKRWDRLHPNKPQRETKDSTLPAGLLYRHVCWRWRVTCHVSRVTRCGTRSSKLAKPKSLWWDPRLQTSLSPLLTSSFLDLRSEYWSEICPWCTLKCYNDLWPWPWGLVYLCKLRFSSLCWSLVFSPKQYEHNHKLTVVNAVTRCVLHQILVIHR